jgi:hypothetical protein
VTGVAWGTIDSAIGSNMNPLLATLTHQSHLGWLDYDYNTYNRSGGTNQPLLQATYSTYGITPRWYTSTTLSIDDVTNELQDQIISGLLPAPVAATAYMIFLPPGYTVRGVPNPGTCGDHTHGTVSGFDVGIAIVGDPSGCKSPAPSAAQDKFDAVSVTASHELMEMITDPSLGGHNAWTNGSQGEIADYCVGPTTSLAAVMPYSFAGTTGNNFVQVAQAYSNFWSGRAGKKVCVGTGIGFTQGSQPFPYAFNIAQGGSVTQTVITDATYINTNGNNANVHFSFSSTSTQTSTTVNGVTLTLSQSTGASAALLHFNASSTATLGLSSYTVYVAGQAPVYVMSASFNVTCPGSTSFCTSLGQCTAPDQCPAGKFNCDNCACGCDAAQTYCLPYSPGC